MLGKLDNDDRKYLQVAVELSRSYLAACYWASISRVVFAATSHDLVEYDFQDLAIYAQLGQPAQSRLMREDADEEELRPAGGTGVAASVLDDPGFIQIFRKGATCPIG
jgi:hypothetical protein